MPDVERPYAFSIQSFAVYGCKEKFFKLGIYSGNVKQNQFSQIKPNEK
jgi:hypothetical protein